MQDGVETNGCYFNRAAPMIRDRTSPDRTAAIIQNLSNHGSSRTIRTSQSDLSMYRLKRRRSLAGLAGRIEKASPHMLFLAAM